MNTLKRFIVLVGVVLALLVAGCATPPEPFEYQQNNELKPGPGILTGEEGAFTIYGEPAPAKKEKPAPEDASPDDSVSP
jgi:hypothetical protein